VRWAQPAAWVLAAGVLLPLAAHLLSRRPPRALPFPTLLFLRATPSVARRLRSLQDRRLWALRTLVVLVVAGAAAGPTLVTRSREASWEPPLFRVVVGAAGATAGGGPAYATTSVRDGLAAAIEDLTHMDGARREIVVRWDGRRDEFEPADLDRVPAAVGIRLEVHAPVIAPEGTRATGVIIGAASEDELTRQRVIDALPAFGLSGAEADVAVLWPGHHEAEAWLSGATPAGRALQAWQRRMRSDPRLADAARRSRRDVRASGGLRHRSVLAPLAVGLDGDVLLWGAETAAGPLLVVDGRPSDPLGVWSVAVALDALRGYGGWRADAGESWTADELAAAERPPPQMVGGRLPSGLDSRWWWAAALVLLMVEGQARRLAGRAPASDEGNRAA
jgi:hypothetical protein